ncbi:MAG: PPOX class F420-dependent oxidoreductase [Polyangiales bacterium]
MHEIDNASYISFTTFTRDGRRKPTPVWVTGANGTYRFYTGVNSWKAKRLRNTRDIEVCVCDARGRVKPGTTIYRGTAELRTDQASIDAVIAAISAKYGWMARLVKVTDAIKSRLGRGEPPVAIHIKLVKPSLQHRSQGQPRPD